MFIKIIAILIVLSMIAGIIYYSKKSLPQNTSVNNQPIVITTISPTSPTPPSPTPVYDPLGGYEWTYYYYGNNWGLIKFVLTSIELTTLNYDITGGSAPSGGTYRKLKVIFDPNSQTTSCYLQTTETNRIDLGYVTITNGKIRSNIGTNNVSFSTTFPTLSAAEKTAAEKMTPTPVPTIAMLAPKQDQSTFTMGKYDGYWKLYDSVKKKNIIVKITKLTSNIPQGGVGDPYPNYPDFWQLTTLNGTTRYTDDTSIKLPVLMGVLSKNNYTAIHNYDVPLGRYGMSWLDIQKRFDSSPIKLIFDCSSYGSSYGGITTLERVYQDSYRDWIKYSSS